MKRMLAQKFIDYVKKLFEKIDISSGNVVLRTDGDINNHDLYNIDEINANAIFPNADRFPDSLSL